MNTDVTVKELASMAADQDTRCQVWSPMHGVVFDGTFEELLTSHLGNKTVDNFSIEDEIFVMNI